MAYDIATTNSTMINDIQSKVMSALTSLDSMALSSAYALYNPSEPNKFNSVVNADVPTLEKVDLSQLPSISEIMSTIGSIEPGAFPAPLDSGEVMKYKNHVWEAKQLDNIQTTLTAYMNDMGMPSQAFQDAVFNADKERKSKILSDKLDMIAAKTSARGFKYANMQTNALIKDAITEYGYDLEDLNRKVTQIVTEWARQNFQFSIQQGISVEVAHMEFAYKFSSIFREVYLTQIKGVLEVYKGRIEMELAKLDARVKSILTRAEGLKINSLITEKEAGLNLEKDKIQVQEALGVFATSSSTIHDNATVQLDAAKTRASQIVEVLKSISNTAIEISKPVK